MYKKLLLIISVTFLMFNGYAANSQTKQTPPPLIDSSKVKEKEPEADAFIPAEKYPECDMRDLAKRVQ